MTILETLNKKDMSIYRLAKLSMIPYATVNDICNGKTHLEKCTAETVYRLSQALDIPMEELLEPYLVKRSSFENFKSSICHRVKEMGDIDFIIDTLQSEEIRTYYDREWYPESFYLLAMLDYLSRENDIPICDDYDDLRPLKLEKPVYPSSIMALYVSCNDKAILDKAEESAIPEFKQHNIIESEVRNVI